MVTETFVGVTFKFFHGRIRWSRELCGTGRLLCPPRESSSSSMRYENFSETDRDWRASQDKLEHFVGPRGLVSNTKINPTRVIRSDHSP